MDDSMYNRPRSLSPASPDLSVAEATVIHAEACLPPDDRAAPISHDASPDVSRRIATELADYQSLFHSASEGMYRSLPGGGFLDVNPAMARIFGFRSPAQMLLELASGAARLYVDAGHAQRVDAQLRDTGRIEQCRAEVRRHDGTCVWISENARAVCDESGLALFYEGTVVDITALVAHEAALKQSIGLYSTLVDNNLDGVFLLQHGLVLFANRALCRMLGYDLGELLGHDYMDAVAPASRSDQLARRVRREDGGKDVFTHELSMLHKDGSERLIRVCSAGVDYNGAIASTGTIRDITDERAAQLATERSEMLHRALIDQSQVGVFILRDGCFNFANRTLEKMLGFEPGGLIGMPVQTVVESECGESADTSPLIDPAAYITPSEFDAVLRHRSDGRVYVSVSCGEFLLNGIAHLSGTVRDVTRHRLAEMQLKYRASHDALTKLANRDAFKRQLGKAIERSTRRGDGDYAVLFLDLDGFKLINDGLGHLAGDHLLMAIAERLKASLKGEALVARYGGDEFAILPTGACNRERAVDLAHRVVDLFDSPFSFLDQEVYSAASIGIVLGQTDSDTPDTMLRDADTAMYRAKKSGKGAFVVFDPAMHQAVRARFELNNDLRRALERNEFRTVYQPIVEMATGTIVGCEALARWQHPTRGLLEPAEFLHAAEETGIIVGLDWWMLNEACRTLAQWQSQFGHTFSMEINVNLDERQLDDRRFVSRLADIIGRNRIDPRLLALEVTETVFRSGRTDLQQTFLDLKRLGVILVVDDFGTGYSSLESFAAAPFDMLKIDRSFVQDMAVNPRHRAIVRTISRFAKDLNLKLTAEGVETVAQARILADLGCATAQGFLYSRPVSPDAMEKLIRVSRRSVKSRGPDAPTPAWPMPLLTRAAAG